MDLVAANEDRREKLPAKQQRPTEEGMKVYRLLLLTCLYNSAKNVCAIF
jgi:hypothetical protein